MIKNLEMDHWVLFDTLRPDQLERLREVIVNKTPPEPFDVVLAGETQKLERK